ncbi:MAG: flagellar export chaperone FlgN [Pirellulales bacterium]|nr:flagellar export chaperone FlgN [Pirellulales bacterium]
MQDSWTPRVMEYLSELRDIAQHVHSLLDQTHVETAAVEAGKVEQSVLQLQESLKELEQMVVRRQDLLQAEDAPAAGASLGEKLRRSSDPAHQTLAQQCDDLSKLIEQANLRAVSLFVCQFHLSDLTTEIVRLLSGVTTPPTYNDKGNLANPGGGTLFNEAA